ncbi:hypothetical protein [Inhella proteolytica]|uniref:Uncharacterized protein n=1 Tax=Inhella proteolytica TaxID=2795029 RepID=A0A931J2E6_9BURK|nr:hypothetical protein [Inhella proteolytica]MBH9577061.1 hypothetical protein [Inhella proteolytica]
MPTSFRLRPRTQALVARWLVGIWLFAIAQSLAHACLLQARGAELGSEPVRHVHAHEHPHEHSGAPQPSDAGEVLCLKTCDDTQAGAWSAGLSWLPDLGAALPASFRPWQLPLPGPGLQLLDAVAPPGDPPLSIRFLKLNR